MIIKMSDHCCKLMSDFVNDKRLPLKYYPQYREYNIPLIGSNAMQGIIFCPWCGKKLPRDLREEYYDVLESEYHITEDQNIPSEFKTDEWWKKRGL